MKIQLFDKINSLPDLKAFNDTLPVFATQEYADYLTETRGFKTVWFLGTLTEKFRFIIPFTIRKKHGFKTGFFQTATVYSDDNIDIESESIFLNEVLSIIKEKKICDWIEQPPNWALFRTVPEGSIYCKFGTYRIELSNKSEDELYKNINYHHKRLINKSIKNDVIVKNGKELIDDCSTVFTQASKLGNHTLLNEDEIKQLFNSLPAFVTTFVAYNNSAPKSSIICFSSKWSVYAVFIANTSPNGGENHLLHWEAIKDAKHRGIRYFDFVGARMNPLPGSKLEGIQKFKKYFGGALIEGYLWKMPVSKFKYHLYNILIFLYYIIKFKKYKGDIIDQELKRAGN
ncbi:MAG: peptidoglycan bridge formation glycyltransferase FemA/FemB family protein [Ignavibacteria bacterium]|nr:peptidoglycan bridge formation glycyltransferase FemA/FemB family protein [Ignavibacteria bacterium]